MDSHDRYVLAISLLGGDLQARKILADLLEEQGDRGLAQWARGGGNTKHRRLDLALMLLPCREALGLAMEFIQRVLTTRADTKLLRDVAQEVGIWQGRKKTNPEMLDYCDSVLKGLSSTVLTHRTPTAIRRATCRVDAILNYLEAVRCSVYAVQCEFSDEISGTPRHWESSAQQHLRQVAAACQRHAQPARPASGPTPAATEIDWQIERTKGHFQSLLNPGPSADQA